MKKILTLLAVTIACTMNAQFNTNYGDSALNNITSGTWNSAFGYKSLFSNTEGKYILHMEHCL